MAEKPTSGVDVDGLVSRAKAILLTPKEEWPKIAAETASTGDIFKKYVLPLAAIGPICAFLGGQIFGYGGFGFTIRPSFTAGLSTLIVTYILALVGVFVLAFIANFFAPKFGGQESSPNAFKLVAYSLTASWLAGVFGIIPSLGFLAILGLYSFYLFYVGATPLMKVPEEKTGSYTAVTVVAAILIYFLAAMLTGAVAGAFMGAAQFGQLAGGDEKISGTVNVPGVGSIDLGKAQQAADRMEKMAAGEIKPIETAKMQALLPADIGSYKRIATESTAMGGVGSQAQATYESGNQRFDLRIVDTHALGGMAGLAAAMNIESSREDGDGYERVRKVDGQMVSEKWRKSNNSGSYGVFFNDRFMIEAEGAAANIDELKAAVSSINQRSLAALAS